MLEPANRDLLAETLLHHVVPGAAVVSNDIPNGATVLEAANGDTIQVNRGGEDVNVDGVGVSAFDIPASNGVIHVIDDVLLSPEVIAALEAGTVAATPLPAETTTPPAATTAPATSAPATPAPATTAPAEPVRGLW
ncbi:MAG: fasciclin domain-containing protein [Cyanobacteria bacterium P01_H01_bin.162]